MEQKSDTKWNQTQAKSSLREKDSLPVKYSMKDSQNPVTNSLEDSQNPVTNSMEESRASVTNSLAQSVWQQYCTILKNKPLVHCITNVVTVNDCANILLAAGASPTMASHPLEVEEVTSGCKSLVCNFGAIKDYQAMLIAGKRAYELGHPIIIDPVGIGGSTYRRELLYQYINRVPVTCIRGNASEIQALVRNQSTVTGVDAGEETTLNSKDELLSQVKAFCNKHHCIIVISGERDFVTNGEDCYEVANGHPLMTRITGSGCMSSALLGAYLSLEESLPERANRMMEKSESLPEKADARTQIDRQYNNSVFHAVACCVIMGICGEIAAEKTQATGGGTMTFHTHLIDTMSLLSEEEIRSRIQVRKL